MLSHRYTAPGHYVAICNNTNFDGHYVVEFDLPDRILDGKQAEAGWYFLNHIDFTACLEAVYPTSIFARILGVSVD